MRVLQICPKPPVPSIDGGCLAMNAMTEGFVSNGAKVKILTASTNKHPLRLEQLDKAYLEKTSIEGIQIETEFDVRDAYISLFNGASYNISRFFAHHFAVVLENVLSRHHYDVIHLESLYATPYIETIRRHAPNALVSLRSHNHEHQIWEQRWKASRNPISRLALRHLSKSLERYEKDILNHIDALVAISELEAEGYKNWGYSGPLFIAGFGIDIQPEASPSRPVPNSDKSKLKLFHIGAMDWGPNKEGVDWFVEKVWPELYPKHPHIELHLAGKGMDSSWYSNHPKVFNHGEVPDAKVFSMQNDLLVVPLLRGAGVRVKIVEAMAQGIPVATTTLGSTGLGLEGHGCLLDTKPEGMAAALSELLDNPDRLHSMRTNSLEVVHARFDRHRIGKDVLEFYGNHV
jgi:glycosyltransferase involved in cell wall biosynthesis